MPHPFLPRRDFLGAAALSLAGLAVADVPLSAEEARKAPLKRPPNPFVYRFKIGDIEAFSISDGHMLFREGLSLMWPAEDRPVMKQAMISNRERLDALPLYINVLALKLGDEVALIDAGLGERNPNPNFGWLEAVLRSLDITREQVKVGFLSHAHGDHLDGFIHGQKPAFPNAKIYLLQQEYDFWRGPNPDFSKSKRDKQPLPGMVKSVCKNFDILQEHLVIAKDGQKLFHDAVEIIAAPGHTDGHACFEIRSGKDSLMHISDVVHHHLLMFDNVGWTVAMDHDPETAVQTRKKLFTRMAASRSRAFGFHLPWPGIGTVVPKGDQYAWVPERWTWGS
ncbi:MAG: MBL fold metallo-hydrolase [Planctomycetes bacterium]|nr:MBL fold metallo-hydrolase [Planctomycetota bacterium]